MDSSHRAHSTHLRSRIAAAAIHRWFVACLLSGSIVVPASADTHTWTNGDAADSYWSTAGNWSPAGPPAFGDDAIVSPGILGGNGPAVVNTGTASITNLEVQKNILNDEGEIDLQAGTTLAINGGDLTNDGLIVVNSDGGSTGGRVLFSAYMGDIYNTLSGTGTILLQAGSDFGITPASIQTSGSYLTQESGHTIRGVGQISVSMANNGSILAADYPSVPGANTLEIVTGITNNNVLGAESGGTLDIFGNYSLSQGASGVIQADDGGTVRLRNSVLIFNGSLATKGTGLINNNSGQIRLTDVTNEGTYQINVPATTVVSGSGLTNNGEIDNFGSLSYLVNGVLDGTGSLVLGSVGSIDNQPGVVVTHGSGHTIRGQGEINAIMTNNGTIQAEGGTLSLVFDPITNNHEMRATSGSTLFVRNEVTQNITTGKIIAEDGGTVKLGLSSRVIDGTLESQGSGVILGTDGAFLRDVVNGATIHVLPDTSGGSLNVEGAGLENNGSIVVNPAASAASYSLRFVGDPQMSLSGSGNVDLNGVNTTLFVGGTVTLTNEANHTIKGPGTILGELINEGTVTGGTIAGPVDIIQVAGRLSGTGDLKDIRFTGTHAPGTGGAGSVSVDGQYEIAAGGKLEIEIGGTTGSTDYDVVDITGSATLLGTVQVDLINNFLPQAGQTYQFLTTTTGVNNAFVNEVLPDLYGGLYLDVQYPTNQAVLAVEGILGDYNLNGTVDAADYAVWRDTLGSTTDMRANGDNTGASMGIIDAADYALWRANFGMVAPIPGGGAGEAALAAVPEPTTASLLCVGILCTLTFLRCSRKLSA